jgi:succinate---hydroxymethylglutarate CoA-transferase
MVAEIEHSVCGRMKLVNTPVKYSSSKPSIRTAPPTLGQHTEEVLQSLIGLSTNEIQQFRNEGVLA